jgi:hypothetical protein
VEKLSRSRPRTRHGRSQTIGGAGSLTVLPLPCANTGSNRRASRTQRHVNLVIGVAAVFCSGGWSGIPSSGITHPAMIAKPKRRTRMEVKTSQIGLVREKRAAHQVGIVLTFV